MNTKTFLSVLLLALSVSALAQTKKNPDLCKSSDPRLTAEEVECFPQDNLMIIHKPKYRYTNQELNLLDWYGRSTSEQAEYICAAFGSEKIIPSPETEYYNFYSYGKEGVIYYGKNKIHLYSQAKYNPIKKITCNLILTRPRAQLDDHGIMRCFDINQDGTRGDLNRDEDCAANGEWRKNSQGKIGCYSLDYLNTAYGLPRSSTKWCDNERINPNLKIDPTLE